MAASIQIPTTFTAKDKFSRVVKGMTRGVKKFGRSGIAAVKRFDTRVTKTFKKLGKFGQLAVGVGLGTLFSMGIANNIAYNDSLASVSAITGAVGKDLEKLEALSMNTAKASKMLGADVLKAYELVGSAKPELLENAEALDGVTRSVITLSKASRMDMEASAKSLTDVMNQFNIAGKDSGKVIDVLAAGAKFGAAAIPQISDAIVQFGTVAKQSNVSLQESVAAIEVFASKGIKGAEAGTKMRNVLTTLATAKALPKKAQKELAKFGVDLDIVSDASLPLNQRLKEMSKIAGDATAMVKVFGKENQGAGAILLNNIDALEDLTAKVDENGVAQTQATTNTNTLKFALESIKTSFLNATTASNSKSKSLKIVKKALKFVADNMETVIAIGGILLAGFVALKVASGIMTAISIATKIWTAAQWLLNIALNANPIGLIVLGIAALIGIIAAVIVKYDEWGAGLTLLMGPFGMIINLIMSFRRNWDMIKKSFKDGGIVGGLKAIGKVLIDALLFPIQKLLELVSKIPGLGDLAGKGASKIAEMRAGLGLETGETTEKAEVLPSTTQATNTSVVESTNNSSVDINIKDKGGNVESAKQTSGNNTIPITTTNTVGDF